MNILQSKGTRFSNHSGEASFGSATVTRAAVTGRIHYITDISATSDHATSVINISSPGTNLWRDRFYGSTYTFNWVTPLTSTTGSAVTFKVFNGTGSAYINVSGFFIDNIV